MAVQDYKINYKSDFVLTINGDAGWAIPFCIKFWTGMPSQAYFVGFDGVKYVNCRVGDTPTQLLVMFDDHHLPIGKLKMQIAYHTTIEEFPGSVFDEVTNARDVIVTIDGTDYQVLLDFTGEDAPELEFNLPAYANEAERIQNELQRQQNEAARIAAELQREQSTAAAVQGAESVNAQLAGNILTVTNRNGVSTSVNTKGEQGEQGPVGPEGPQGETGISIVSFLPKSETATTLIYTITYSNGYTQDVAIPKGPKGDTGATGLTGPQGPRGDTGVSITGFVETGETETATLYNITFSNGTTQQVSIPKGEKGDQGPVGPQGPQGPMGDVAVITPEQQAAFTMYSEPGQNTNGPMTQKATTDALNSLAASDITYQSDGSLAAENVQGALDEVGKDIFDMTTASSTTIWNQGYRQTGKTTQRDDVIYSNWQWYPDGVLIKTTEDYYIHSIIVLASTPYQVGGDRSHAMSVNYGENYFVINIKREDGQNLTPTDGASNVTLNTATTVLKSTDIVDDVLHGGSSKVLSAEQGKRIADNIFDPYIFHMGDINYQTGVQSEGDTTNIYLKDYIEINAQVTPVLKYMGNTLTAGNRYYDANKTYLGTSYTANAVYWRVAASLGGAESDVETVNANTTLTINGEEYHGGSLKALAEKVYTNDIFKENETVQDAIDELRLKTDALDVAVLPIPADGIRKNRTLIWHDEFNTPTVSDKWDNLSGAYNQNYYMGNVNKNAFCMDNALHLTNLKDYPAENFDYSGAFLLTNKKFDFRYGLIEAKIKFPDNYEHFHSTLWMIGSSFEWNSGDTNKGMRWPKCGEIDIAECDDYTVNSTVHWGETENASSEQLHHVVNYYGSSRRSGWHVYSLEWTSTGLSFYCDGQLFSGVPLSRYDIDGFNAFRRSMYFALNQNPHNVKNPRQWSTLDEITTEVAWIRVYAPVGVTPTIPTTATLSETSLSMNVGDSVDLDVTFDNDETVIDRTVVWESYNENVATFHGGRVTATGTGTTFVACTHKYGARALCKVVVS